MVANDWSVMVSNDWSVMVYQWLIVPISGGF